MHVQRCITGVEVWAPAKLNLFLEVSAKRDDGFHEIETLMVPVALYDTLQFIPTAPGQITLDCRELRATGEPLPPADQNLVVRAVKLLAERSGARQGAQLRLVKRIPLASGLAGGSSDAAAALVAANEAWQLGWPAERLAALGAELGSDIPFFFAAGPAMARGRGEIIEPVAPFGPLEFVVVRPPEGLATPAVYRACRPSKAPSSVADLLAALRRGDWPQAAKQMYNGLQLAAQSLSTWIQRLQSEFAKLDCLGHLMSGSGTAYYGVCRHARHAQRIAATLRSRGIGHVYAARACY